MSRLIPILLTILTILTMPMFGSALAVANPAAIPADRLVRTHSADAVRHGGVLDPAKADTIYVYGGPGSLEGKFETAGGLPDRQGWIGVDLTVAGPNAWHVDVFNAANLDPLNEGNRAWWCGELFDSCGAGDPPEGYGNGYDYGIEWSGAVGDSGSDVTVLVAAVLNHHTEPGYDYVRLQYEGASGWTTVWEADELGIGVTVAETFVVTAADYQNGDEVRLRWHVESDGAWSDADCLYPSAGAVQVDLINVQFNQGSWVDMGTETCEFMTQLWEAVVPQGCGDFSKVWPVLTDLDPCAENGTPQFAFIDDGIVVPGTGGSQGITWTYGPSGWVVNSTGGLLGDSFYLDNSIWSPPIDLPGGEYEGHRFAFDIWPHMPIASGVFWNWHVRWSQMPSGDDWVTWQDRSFLYYGDDRYRRMDPVLTDLVPPNALRAQIGLSVKEYGWIWGIHSNDVTPAPYYDNVSYQVFSHDGPSMTTRAMDLALDGFAQGLDPGNPASHAVRFDAGRFPGQGTTPADSLVLTVMPQRNGAALVGPPRMRFKLFGNPDYDPWRTATVPPGNVIDGEQVYTSGGTPVPDRWEFDLPDTGFLFPGDVLHYFFESTSDIGGGDVKTAMLPADTTGYASAVSDYDELYRVRCLPSISDPDGSPSAPQVLLWSDASVADREVWVEVLRNVFFTDPGSWWDLYATDHAHGSGIGLRAPPNVLDAYDVIIYSGGDRSSDLLIDWDGPGEMADISVLEAWLAMEDKGLAVWGDNVVSELESYHASTIAFANGSLGATAFDADIGPLIGGQISPQAVPLPVSPPWFLTSSWRVGGICPDLNTFDALLPSGSGYAAAEWLDAGGSGGVYPYASVMFRPDPTGRGRLTFPYDLATVVGDSPIDDFVKRKSLVADLLITFGVIVPVPGVDDDGPSLPKALAVANHPNPFNPKTTLSYALPQSGAVTIEIFNLRGERVRTLLDEVRPAGRGTVDWHGRNDRGGAVGSGVYFGRVTIGGATALTRMVLLR